jgi:glycosyltransferase involved in cell wall biosynthesis
MGLLYAMLVLSFIGLVIINVTFLIINFINWSVNGLDFIIHEETFVEIIYFSIFLKWMALADVLWIIVMLGFMLKRKHYKTDSTLHYLTTQKIDEPKLCVIIPTFNEENSIETIIHDFQSQENIQNIIVVDNHSTDKTVELAKKFDVTIIQKDTNKGLADSVFLGLSEFLKTTSNIVVITECDGTFSGNDLTKMIPYLDNCDMVIGTRQVQVLTEKNNQNSMFYVWGNYALAKLIQLKYFSLTNLGIVELTDVGCLYRCIRRDALEKIKHSLNSSEAQKIVKNPNSGLIANFLTLLAIENNFRLVEIPITFRVRTGISKTESDKKFKAIVYGLRFFWFILIK